MSESRNFDQIRAICHKCGTEDWIWMTEIAETREVEGREEVLFVPWYWYGAAVPTYEWGGREPLCRECREVRQMMVNMNKLVNG